VDTAPKFPLLATTEAGGDCLDIVVHLAALRRLSVADYVDFFKRARWKEYHRTTKNPTVGRYLDVVCCKNIYLRILFKEAYIA